MIPGLVGTPLLGYRLPSPAQTPASAHPFQPSLETPSLRRSPDPPYGLSPRRKIRSQDCSCQTALNESSYAVDFVVTTLSSFSKSDSRIAHSKAPSSAVQSAERLTRGLRNQGHELFHLVAVKHHTQSAHLRKMSVVFLVPCPLGHPGSIPEVGHRWVGEVMIVLRVSGGVEMVGERYATDWEDWHIYKEDQYLRDERSEPLSITCPARDRSVRGAVVGLMDAGLFRRLVEGIFTIIRQTIPGCSADLSDEIGYTLKHLRLTSTAQIVRADIEWVYTQAQVVKRGRYIRVELHQEGWDEAVPVTLLIEVSRGKQPGEVKIKPMEVIYADEYPLRHRYTPTISPPSLKGLRDVINAAKTKSVKGKGKVPDTGTRARHAC